MTESRNPQNRASITKMSSDAVGRYKRMKDGSGVVGWSSARDPWGWATQQPGAAWERSENGSHPDLWPPTVSRS